MELSAISILLFHVVLGVENKKTRRGGGADNYYSVNTSIIVLYQMIVHVLNKIPDANQIVGDDRRNDGPGGIIDSGNLLPDSASMMFGILAISLPLLVADPRVNPRDDLPYLPDDLCVDFTVIREAEAIECPDYYLVNPATGSVLPYAIPQPIDKEFAEILDEVLKRGYIILKRGLPSK